MWRIEKVGASASASNRSVVTFIAESRKIVCVATTPGEPLESITRRANVILRGEMLNCRIAGEPVAAQAVPKNFLRRVIDALREPIF
jgi:hypothetical protein